MILDKKKMIFFFGLILHFCMLKAEQLFKLNILNVDKIYFVLLPIFFFFVSIQNILGNSSK